MQVEVSSLIFPTFCRNNDEVTPKNSANAPMFSLLRGTAYSGNTCDPVKLPKSLLVTLCPHDVGKGKFWVVFGMFLKKSKRTRWCFPVFSQEQFSCSFLRPASLVAM